MAESLPQRFETVATLEDFMTEPTPCRKKGSNLRSADSDEQTCPRGIFLQHRRCASPAISTLIASHGLRAGLSGPGSQVSASPFLVAQ
jgi:hypothetical protein